MDDPQQQRPQSPGPSPSPQSPGVEDQSGNSSTGSGKDSPADAPAAFVGDPGPQFQPSSEPEPAAVVDDRPPLIGLPSLEPEWEDQAVARLLLAKGELLHTFIGVADDDWRYTEADLRAIAPPLSRILNRYPATKAAAVGQDPLALAIATSAYAIRSAQERSAVLKARAEEEVEQPITGVDAHPGNQPPGPDTPPIPDDAPADGEWRIAN